MKKYRYVFAEKNYYEVIVEAENENAAMDEAVNVYSYTGGDELEEWHETFIEIDGEEVNKE